MSWVRIYIHVVFSTKNREAFLDNYELRKKVFQHIKNNAESKGVYLDCVSGYSDHAHCLISLGKEQSVSQVVQLIKGESSFWINQNNLSYDKFAWQDDYWAVGVSESHLEAVRQYIFNQETHHSEHSFVDEIEGFMNKYGWTYSLR